MNRKLSFFTILIFTGLLIFSSGCTFCGQWPFRACARQTTNLVVWNLFDDTDTWQGMIDAYIAAAAADPSKPKVKIQYYKKNIESYERDLADAFASGQGPDIFVIHNDWLPKYKNKISPMNGGASVAKSFERKFVDVVSNDFLSNNNIYAVPLSVDTLALYYNENIFRNAGIYNSPKTWDEFKEDVIRLTVLDEKNNIVRAGAAIGTDKNINRSSDILTLLMMQSGSPIVDNKIAVFGELQKDNESKTFSVGGMALQFYTDFANPAKSVYTWNPTMDYSIDAFYQGRAAMMINYSYHIPTVVSKAPKLNFAVGPMPQITGTTMPVNYANYWAMTVSAGSDKKDAAWEFLTYVSNPEITKKYIEKAKRPVAQRELVDWQEKGEDLNLAVYARQSLAAKSWYQADPSANEIILNDAIKTVVLGRSTPVDAASLAASQITQTMK